MRHLSHYGIHFLAPIVIALIRYPGQWKKVSLILWAGILIDIDHLWAVPIFDNNRCSIGFHWLHGWVAFIGYLILAAIPKSRLWGLAFLIHLLADVVDCLWIMGVS